MAAQTTVEEQIKALEGGDQNHSAELKKLEDAATVCRRKAVEIQSAMEANSNMIAEEQNMIADSKKEIQKKENEKKAADTAREKIKDERQLAEAEKARLDNEVLRAQQAVAVIVTGVGGQENAEFGWKNQCQTAERELNELERKMNIQKGTLENIRKTLPAASRDHDRLQQEHQVMMNNLQRLGAEVSQLQQELAESPPANQEQLTNLRQQQRQFVGRQANLDQRIRQVEGEIGHLNLRFNPPGHGFDENKFHGAVANFFTVKDPDRFLAAVDVC